MAEDQWVEYDEMKYFEDFNAEVDRIAKAIKSVESAGQKDPYKATSKDGGVGAYQFTGTWEPWSSEYAKHTGIGDAPLPMTPENQDAVARFKIAQKLNEGYEPKQIASWWNSNSPNWKGKVGKNKAGLRYDVPAYVEEKFWPRYLKLGGLVDLLGPSEAHADESPKQDGWVEWEPGEQSDGWVDYDPSVEQSEPPSKLRANLDAFLQPASPFFHALITNPLLNKIYEDAEVPSIGRTIGVGLGLANAPGAFVRGAMVGAQGESPVRNALETGIRSAFNSVVTPGDWGVGGEELINSLLGEKAENIPEAIRPLVNIGAEVATDPLSIFGVIKSALLRSGANAARQFMDPGLWNQMNRTGTLPLFVSGQFNTAKHMADVAKLDAMEAAERGPTKLLEYNPRPETYREVSDPMQYINRQLAANQEAQLAEEAAQRAAMDPREIAAQHYAQIETGRPELTLPEDIAAMERRVSETPPSQIVEEGPRVLDPTLRRQSVAGVPVEEIAGVRGESYADPMDYIRAQLGRNAREQVNMTRFGYPSESPVPPQKPFMAVVEQPQVRTVEKVMPEGFARKLDEGVPRRTVEEAKILERAKSVGETPALGGVEAGKDYATRMRSIIEKIKSGKTLTPEETALVRSEGGFISFRNPVDDKYKELMKANPYHKRIQQMVGESGQKTDVLGDWSTALFDRYTKIRRVAPETYDKIMRSSSEKDVLAFEVKELSDALGEVRRSPNAFNDLLLAERSISRAKKPTEDLLGNYVIGLDNPAGVTLKEAQAAKKAILDGYAKAGGDPVQLQTAIKTWTQWTNRTILDRLESSGIISSKMKKDIIDANDVYATFKVLHYQPDDLSKVPSNLATSQYYSVANQKILQREKGTLKQIANPIEATFEKLIDTVSLANRNKVASSFVDEMMGSTLPNVRGLIRPIAKNEQEFLQMKAKGLNPINSDWKKTLEPSKWDTISRFKEGEVSSYVVDKELSDILKASGSLSAPRIVQAFGSLFRRAATSAYLPFTLSNASRDAFMAYTIGPYGKSPLDAGKFIADWTRGLVEGFKHEFGTSQKVQDLLKSGMGMGFTAQWRTAEDVAGTVFKKSFRDMSLKEIAKTLTIDSVDGLLKQIEKFSSAVELAPRVAVADRAMKMSKTMEEAAMLARGATVDFSRAGRTLRVWNQFVPFLNARMQSRVVLAEALRDPSRQMNTLAKGAYVGLAGALLAYHNLSEYGDLYREIPEYIRKDYFCFITGETTDPKTGERVPQYFKISKGDIGQLTSNPIEFALERQYLDNKPGWQQFVMSMADAISPVSFVDANGNISAEKFVAGLTPPAARAVVENMVNKNFYTGMPVESPGMQNVPEELRSRKDTSESFKYLAENVVAPFAKIPIIGEVAKQVVGSPLKMQNLARGLLAGYGASGLSPDALLKSMGERFYSERGGESRRKTAEAYYDTKRDYEYTRSRAKVLLQRGDERGALDLLENWNNQFGERVKGIEAYGMKDEGGLQGMIFTPQKIRNLMRSVAVEEEESNKGIQSKLQKKRRR